jgi:predicted RNA-binding Zn ribbon-like protein
MVAYVTLPSWVPDGHKQAPLPLLVVQSFVNTRDLDQGTDLLAEPGPASAWLRAAGLLSADATVTADGLATAREVRESIRALLARNTPGPPAGRGTARALAAEDDPAAGDALRPGEAGGPGAAGAAGDALAPLRALAGAGRPRLAVLPDGRVQLAAGPAGSLTEGLLRLLVVIRDAQQDGSWARLKICGNPDCQWAFFDRSHSRQGSWCDMSSCGNLIKNRNLRARRRVS